MAFNYRIQVDAEVKEGEAQIDEMKEVLPEDLYDYFLFHCDEDNFRMMVGYEKSQYEFRKNDLDGGSELGNG